MARVHAGQVGAGISSGKLPHDLDPVVEAVERLDDIDGDPILEHGAWLVCAPHWHVEPHGGRTALAPLLLGLFLDRRDFPTALEHAVAALEAIPVATEATDEPELALVVAQDAVFRSPVRYPAKHAGWAGPRAAAPLPRREARAHPTVRGDAAPPQRGRE